MPMMAFCIWPGGLDAGLLAVSESSGEHCGIWPRANCASHLCVGRFDVLAGIEVFIRPPLDHRNAPWASGSGWHCRCGPEIIEGGGVLVSAHRKMRSAIDVDAIQERLRHQQEGHLVVGQREYQKRSFIQRGPPRQRASFRFTR
jgi:hypothetical protein